MKNLLLIICVLNSSINATAYLTHIINNTDHKIKIDCRNDFFFTINVYKTLSLIDFKSLDVPEEKCNIMNGDAFIEVEPKTLNILQDTPILLGENSLNDEKYILTFNQLDNGFHMKLTKGIPWKHLLNTQKYSKP